MLLRLLQLGATLSAIIPVFEFWLSMLLQALGALLLAGRWVHYVYVYVHTYIHALNLNRRVQPRPLYRPRTASKPGTPQDNTSAACKIVQPLDRCI